MAIEIQNCGWLVFDAVISISHSHHKVSCFYFENDNRQIVRPEAEHWTPPYTQSSYNMRMYFIYELLFEACILSWCATTTKKNGKNVAKLLEWAYDERNCSLITHTNGPMGKVLNIWGQQQFAEWFMSSDKTQSFHSLSLSLWFSLVIVFILSWCYFLWMRCPLLLSRDRLMLHFTRHTINVIIFVISMSFHA